MRQEAIKQAEKERRDKYKKQEEDREVLRQGIRDKVFPSNFAYSDSMAPVWPDKNRQMSIKVAQK